MDPNDALVLDHGGERLHFRCDFSTLLALEEMDDWRVSLQEAIGFQKTASLIRIAALFTDKTEEEIIALSPPVSQLQTMITRAWSLCIEGPEGLRRYMDAAAKEDAAQEAGKPKTSALASRFFGLFARRSASA